MQTPDVLKKLGEILAAAEREQRFGTVELTIRGGRVTVIGTTVTDRLDQYPDTREKTHVNPTKSYR